MSSRLPRAPHVLVTGTSGAIGSAIARELRARRPEARLTLVDRAGEPSERLAAELGGAAASETAELSEIDTIPALVARAIDKHGPIEGLVNCAGFMEVRRFSGMPWELVWRLLAVDLVAPLRLLSECAREMSKSGGGFVVNVTSMAGRVPIKGCSVYGAAKAGLSMASEVLRAELRRDGIHVVTVYPGPVASELERGARAQFGNGRLARAVPTGDPRALGRLIVEAVEQSRPRVVYPTWYAAGFRAVGLASRITLGLGPEPSS
jgi:short-subunit dehydrogenase